MGKNGHRNMMARESKPVVWETISKEETLAVGGNKNYSRVSVSSARITLSSKHEIAPKKKTKCMTSLTFDS